MASPVVAAITENAVTTAGTSHTVSFTQTTGDLVIIYFGTAVSTAITMSDGFTQLSAGAAVRLHVIGKTLDGSEGGNVVVTTTSSTKSAWTAYNVQGHDTAITPEVTEALGTSTTPDPASITPAGGPKDFLFLVGFNQDGEEADDDTWCTAAPTNYTNLLQKTSGTGGAASSNCSVASAERQLNATTEDPGTFTVVQSLAWRAGTTAIHPAPPAAARVPFYRPYTQLLPQ